MKNLKGYLIESTREKYYKDQFGEWTDTKWNRSPVAVGWLDGRENQAKRFKTLLGIGVQEGDSVLDLGCGLGHMVEYLEKVGLNVCYTGLDTNECAIQEAYQSKEATYIHGTIFDIQERYDWGLGSGVFNVGFPILELLETVNELLSKVNKGVAFNLLKWTSNKNMTYENYHPVEIFSFLNRRGALCTIIENYGIENDFTVYIRKD